ncbi:MAG: hypothetical protein IKY31_07280 [Bacteroidaceae bacterium]|nr:hypothetical protein [Bacteroidaceae bacterium]
MRNYRNNFSRYRLVIDAVCGILFLAFSFVYLYVVQGELMRCLWRDCLGKETYSPLWGALVITCFLWIGQWLLERLTRFGRTWVALPYFSAYCALAFLTCVTPIESGVDSCTYVLGWDGLWWLFPGSLIIYLIVGIIIRCRRAVVRERSLTELLISNLITLIIFSYATGSIGNTNELLRNELLVSQCIRDQRYEDALLVGKKSLNNTPSLTTLRAFALSHNGILGESLFEYPQSDGTNGLFFQKEFSGVHGFTNEDIISHLGGVPCEEGEPVVDYLQRLCESDSTATSQALDYYLSALLLEKRLSDFYQALLQYWPKDTALPRHYQEALILYVQEVESASPPAQMCTSPIEERYEEFLQLRNQYADSLHQKNYTRRKFGDTYWWYYCFGGVSDSK